MKKLKQCQWKLFYLYLSYFTLFYLKLFKQSAAVSDSMEATETEHFIQWVRDNINHNIQTLTGRWTFHGMVIISMRLN